MATTIKVRWSVYELSNVMTLYDTQKVYRSTEDESGPWLEITGPSTRVDLVAGQYDYFYDDTGGDKEYYYATSFYNTSTGAESGRSEPMRAALGTDYLELSDLYALVGPQRVRQYFDDDIDGNIADASNAVNSILMAAEAEAASRLLRSWAAVAVVELGNNDRTFKNHVAWVALEYASERRPEFCGEDGKGQFWAQYERAIKYFDHLSKGRQRSVGESVAGVGANTGGRVQPELGSDESRFVFAPDRNAPTGHGGF
ncbi:MAG: hypothetical protein GY854_02335 [Deltaproteobacteria bacterium]|nr:hypothetical protein [Deltaproteobacteria bacterium]